jgi:hypothetical protein
VANTVTRLLAHGGKIARPPYAKLAAQRIGLARKHARAPRVEVFLLKPALDATLTAALRFGDCIGSQVDSPECVRFVHNDI